MKDYIFKNNLKLIYKNTNSELTSICISLNAGAGIETEKYGVAHATEHMVYKGTKNRTEKEINEGLSNIFGFNNAMTNYPYVIYYGTLLKEDLEKGVDLLSDIILNPSFNEVGFNEEMSVIKEELKEWDEELEQYCEDKLFFNSFNHRRIKYPIIGTAESLEDMSLIDIKDFYSKHYYPSNTSITIISSMKFEKIKDIIYKYFGAWENCVDNKYKINSIVENIKYEKPRIEVFSNEKDGIKICRVEMVCPIDNLNNKEVICLKIFNEYFGEGVNSILYDTLRTKNGLIYDVTTKIVHENYIKLYKITFSTSKENLNKSIMLINGCIDYVKKIRQGIDNKQLEQLIKNFKLKRLFREEQSIVLAKELATYDCMFGDYSIYTNEVLELEELSSEEIFEIASRALKDMTIQIIETT